MVTIRKATADDIDEIERVIRESIVGISIHSYDAHQVSSAVRFVAHLDRELVDDGTYYVAEEESEIVGCGGWSRRSRLYRGSGADPGDTHVLDPQTDAARIRTMFVVPRRARQGIGRRILIECEQAAARAGFRALELMAMLSGEAMYLACGYRAVERVPAQLEDGTPFPLTRMQKTLE